MLPVDLIYNVRPRNTPLYIMETHQKAFREEIGDKILRGRESVITMVEATYLYQVSLKGSRHGVTLNFRLVFTNVCATAGPTIRPSGFKYFREIRPAGKYEAYDEKYLLGNSIRSFLQYGTTVNSNQ